MLIPLTFGIGITGLVYGAIETISEHKKENKIMGYSELKEYKGKGFILSKNVRISEKYSNEGVLMVAPTGARKSRSFIMPNVRKIKNASMLVFDPACEIEEECPRDDMQVVKLNPFDLENSIGFDPLVNCKNTFEVRRIMEVLMINGSNNNTDSNTKSDKDVWVKRSMPLVRSYAIMNFYKNKYPFDVMIRNLMTKPLLPTKKGNMQSILEEIQESDIKEAIIELKSFLQVAGSPTTLACVRDTINDSLQVFHDTRVQQLMRKPTLKFEKMRETPILLYIQVPERYSEYYSPITATLVTQVMDRLLDKPNGLQVYNLFDEFCNIGKLPKISTLLSTCRKRNIANACCIQSLKQLQKVYGELEGDELRDLFKTTLVTGGLRDSSEYFSKIIGKEEYVEQEQTKYRDLMSSETLRQLDERKLIIISGSKRPVKDTKWGL